MEEIIAVVFAIFYMAFYVASCILSIAFLFRHRDYRRRWLPCISVIALPLLELVPETGWSDVRSQWHVPLLYAVWGIWTLFLTLILLRTGEGKLLLVLRGLLGTMGTFTFAACVVSLVESWRFLHHL
jgi:hypothetical protein